MSVIFLNDPENSIKQSKQKTEKASASDIKDMSSYVKLCTSVYEEDDCKRRGVDALHDSDDYKDHVLVLTLNEPNMKAPVGSASTNARTTYKVTKPTKKKKTPPHLELVFSKFRSPLYGEAEDICINSSPM